MLNLTLEDIASGLDGGRFTSEELVKAYIARINEVDQTFKSVIEVNPDAITHATILDEERRSSGRRGPLHGVPILLKDNFLTLDAMQGSSGSYALFGLRPKHEGAVVRKLREAGAILLGKANLSEFCNVRSSVSNSGWSPRGGQCEGAYYPKMSPSGSSSGCAVATDLALCFASIGSETQGSIISPAETSNIVGLKPTVGLVSQDAIIPASKKHDTPGPMARTVKDTALILTAIAGKDLHDPRTAKIPFEDVPNYVNSCQIPDLKTFRIGVPRNGIIGVGDAIMESFEHALTQLKTAGATIVETEYAGADQHRALSTKEKMTSQLTNFHVTIDEFLENNPENPNRIRSLEGIRDYVKNDPREDYPHRDVENWEWALEMNPGQEAYKRAAERDEYFAGEGGIVGALDRSNLDALIYPTAAKMSTHFAAGGGLPVITIPLGYLPNGTEVKWGPRKDLITEAPNKPYGIGLTGREFSEPTLLSIASVYERLSQVRQKAQHYKLPTVGLQGGDLEGRARELKV